MSQLIDGSGRRINYLRISVTDKCNFRCLYCMPEEGLQWLPKADLLTYEEITDVVRQMVPLGVTRLRITGGEPLIRPNLDRLITQLKAIDGIEDIALSTNGVHLPKLAAALAAAGLARVNLSADSLRADRIAKISRRSLGFDPIAAAQSAEKAWLTPVKINVVVMRGVNDDEIEDFARLTLDHPWHIRFIELMPVGEMRDVTWEHVVASDEILERIASIEPLSPVSGPNGNGPAKYFAFEGAPGSVGVITPMTHTYCATCNKVRLTADGRLRTCLFGDHELELRTPLRAGEPIAGIVEAGLLEKPAEHHLLQMKVGGLRALSEVGG
ncbi:MAG: GTP 3',8-cyclase MoaA [Gemmatimonadota bacterium]|nr:GTP 3',8-cyclase MoaA [Gemmatimonadota bacterium]